jgi:hypothetical protein
MVIRVLRGRGIVKGIGEGIALVSPTPLGLLGEVDPEAGYIREEGHPLYRKPIRGRVLVYPYAVGSSVGAYVLYGLKKLGLAPAAIVNHHSDLITASGCALAGIPLVDLPWEGYEELRSGIPLRVDGNRGVVEILKAKETSRSY